ncbi:hypothetical protein ABZ832_22055 [Streptantibioticus parmotrematis]|uniref:hypothetical protein n=1 Tax=Streptantibioticus parmotrematis TaxID=2873249 RepID=UPI003410AC69
MRRENSQDDSERTIRLHDNLVIAPPPAHDAEFFEVVAQGLVLSWGAPLPTGHDYPRKDR